MFLNRGQGVEGKFTKISKTDVFMESSRAEFLRFLARLSKFPY